VSHGVRHRRLDEAIEALLCTTTSLGIPDDDQCTSTKVCIRTGSLNNQIVKERDTASDQMDFDVSKTSRRAPI
jgi:hypothetical protein